MNNFFEYEIKTLKHQSFNDITSLVKNTVRKSNIKDGLVVIFCPHTTAGLTINENTDSNVSKDIMNSLDESFPIESDYLHKGGNSHAHIKSAFISSDKSIILHKGKLMLGTWQGIYFCDFDGPRNRKVYVKIIES